MGICVTVSDESSLQKYPQLLTRTDIAACRSITSIPIRIYSFLCASNMTNDTGWCDLLDLPLLAKKQQIFYTKVKCAQRSLDRFKFLRLSSLLQCQQT